MLLRYSNFQFSVESNPGLHWFCFTVLCEWSRKLAPPSKPIRYKTKTNRDLVTRVFPRLERFSLDCRKTKTKVNTLANQRA